jgi:hypothetical protein
VTLVQCSPKLMGGGEHYEKISVLVWHKRFKVTSDVKIINEENAHQFLRNQGYCSLQILSTRPKNQPRLLCGSVEAVT